MSPEVQIGILALGALFILAFANGFRSASSERTETYNRWESRVVEAVARLEELTLEQLRALKVQLDQQFPSPDTMDFDPLTVVTDPSELSAQAREAATTHRHSVRMESDFMWLKRVGPALQVAYGSAVIGSVALTCYYGDLNKAKWGIVAGWILAGSGVVALVAIHLARAFLISRLGLSQERAGTTDPQ